jgi:hypothetical protein
MSGRAVQIELAARAIFNADVDPSYANSIWENPHPHWDPKRAWARRLATVAIDAAVPGLDGPA